MSSTVTATSDIPVPGHDLAMAVAEVEYDRLLDAASALDADDWARLTECPGWDVRAVLGHLLGMMELNADQAELGRQASIAGERVAITGGYRIDALTALQVEEHAHLTPGELLEAMRKAAPAALAGRRSTTAEDRAAAYAPGPPFDPEWTRGYLLDVIHTRDPWLHRVADIARATGRAPVLTSDHDGRIVADVVAEWAGRHGQAFTLVLDGPAGGTFVTGDGGEHLQLDAIDFCRILSSRAEGRGLLTTKVPF